MCITQGKREKAVDIDGHVREYRACNMQSEEENRKLTFMRFCLKSAEKSPRG